MNAAYAIEVLSLEELEMISGGESKVLDQHLISKRGADGRPVVVGHDYTILSDPFPQGTTPAEANGYLQRFNAPSEAGLTGTGDDPHLMHGFVTDPATGHIPVGFVTFAREPGSVTNTTTPLHPFEGTITRSIVELTRAGTVNEDGTANRADGRLAVLTHGQGLGGYPVSSAILGHYAQEWGNELNLNVGSKLFPALDANMFRVDALEHSANEWSGVSQLHAWADSVGIRHPGEMDPAGRPTLSVASEAQWSAADAAAHYHDGGWHGSDEPQRMLDGRAPGLVGATDHVDHSAHPVKADHGNEPGHTNGFGDHFTASDHGDAQHTARDSGGTGVGTSTTSPSPTHGGQTHGGGTDAQHTARDSGGTGVGTSSTSPSPTHGGSDAQHTARDSGGSGAGTPSTSPSPSTSSGSSTGGATSSGHGGIGHA